MSRKKFKNTEIVEQYSYRLEDALKIQDRLFDFLPNSNHGIRSRQCKCVTSNIMQTWMRHFKRQNIPFIISVSSGWSKQEPYRWVLWKECYIPIGRGKWANTEECIRIKEN